MDQRTERPSPCPVLVSQGARLLAAAAVLAGFVLAGEVTAASSHDAVERKLAEFDAPALLAPGAGGASGQARVAAPLGDRYHAALPEEDGIGCGRESRRPG
jgi:hypothetical protein